MIIEDFTYNSLLKGEDVTYKDRMFNESLFLEPVSQHLKCSICLDVMSQPVQCSSGHCFCKSCILTVLKQQKLCPICRVALLESQLVINRAVEGVIQELLLRCPTTIDNEGDEDKTGVSEKSDGEVVSFEEPVKRCKWKGHLHSCKTHLAECPLARVQCPLPHCGLYFRRQELFDHTLSCGTSPALFYHLYCQVRCGSQDAWKQLLHHANSSSPNPMAAAYTAIVYIHSHISSIPSNLAVAENLAVQVIPYLKEHSDQETINGGKGDNTPSVDGPSSIGSHAAFILGNFYLKGVGFPCKNIKKALKLFELSANAGHAGALCALGLCYDSGTGTSPDMKKAVLYYEEASSRGYASAQLNLGICYYNGEGVPQNRQVAIECYEKAAEAGHATALFNLGVCYCSGEVGGVKNEEMGLRYIRRAALQGYEQALKFLEKYRMSLY